MDIWDNSDSEDDDFMMMILAILLKSLSDQKRNRRYAVRPINRERYQRGFFNNLLKSMVLQDHESFFVYTRMTPRQFECLLRLVGPQLTKDPSKKPLPPAHRLLITLHYLSEGCSMSEIASGHYVGHSTVCVIIHETTQVLWDVLNPIFLKSPTIQDFECIAEGFFKRCNLPNCFGAVDGKHIVMQSPKKSRSMYYRYKHSQSIVLMATCDAYYKFSLVDIGAAGSNHDATIFKESSFGYALLNNKLKVPAPKHMPGSTIALPHFLVADAAFPLHTNIMRPYAGQYLPAELRIFNYRISRARRCIENAFGILASRWRILRKPIIADVSTVEKIARATVVLHNFLQKSEEDMPMSERRYCPTGYTDTILPDGSVSVGVWRQDAVLRSVGRLGSNNSSKGVQANRDLLCNYLSSPSGSVPWQVEYISKGSVPFDD